MSNTIKLKRGSGSDPSASDLSIGEIAIRTDSGKLFTKKDNGSVAEISGSGGIDDGDKGDITVSNGGDTFTIDSGVVTSAKIADGTIVNADINASAAIAGSKINPNFGSQDITTTGELQCKDMSLIDTTPKLTFFDSDNNPDFTLSANSGSFRITDSTNSAERLVVNSDGHVDVLGNLDVGAGIDVTGHATVSQSLTVTGTTSLGETVNITGNDPNITFVDSNNNPDFKIFANAGTFLIHDYTNSNDILKVQTDGHLDITPHTDFAAGIDVTGNITVTGTVDGRDLATDGSKLDGIESGATADQSASEILTLIKTVDGAGSGLDADTLDGISSASFVRSDAADTISGDITFTDSGQYPVVIGSASGMDDGRLLLRGSSNPYIRFREGNTDKAFIQWNSSGYLRLMNQEDSSVLRIKDDIEFSPDNSTYYKMWNAYNDGSGSGLDSDLLDGQEGSYYRNAGNINAGTLLAARLGAASASESGISVVGNFGQWQGHNTYTNFNTVPAYWGWNFVMGTGNAPNSNSSQWYRCRLSLGSDYGIGSDSGDYSLEMALPRFNHSSAGVLHIRTIENGSEGSWTQVGDNASLITTGTLPAARIGSNAVTFARMQDIAEERLIGRVSSGSGDPEALTQAQVRTFLGLASSATTDTTNASNISSGTIPDARFPSTLPAVDGSNLTGISAGATGGGSDEVFYENSQTVTTDYTITNGKNAMSAGPIEIQNGVTVTVGSGETLTIV